MTDSRQELFPSACPARETSSELIWDFGISGGLGFGSWELLFLCYTVAQPRPFKGLPRMIQPQAERIIDNVERVIVGKRPVVELVLIAMLCEGHVLLEDVPGIGK